MSIILNKKQSYETTPKLFPVSFVFPMSLSLSLVLCSMKWLPFLTYLFVYIPPSFLPTFIWDLLSFILCLFPFLVFSIERPFLSFLHSSLSASHFYLFPPFFIYFPRSFQYLIFLIYLITGFPSSTAGKPLRDTCWHIRRFHPSLSHVNESPVITLWKKRAYRIALTRAIASSWQAS